MTFPSEYKPGQVLTADELNASFDAKTENSAAAITGGAAEGLDHVYITGDTESTNLLTGALTVVGGVAIGLRLNVGGKLAASGAATVGAATVSTTPTTGALTVVGGAGIGGALNVGGEVRAGGNVTGTVVVSTDQTNAVSPVTGALKTAGGAGIVKDLVVGGATAVGGALTVQGNATVAGTVTTGGVIISPGGVIIFGDGSSQGGAPIPEAPSDGKKYGRGDKLWKLLTDIPEAPSDGKKYGRNTAAWAVLTDIPEAPQDGRAYGRKNATWANTGIASVDGIVTLVDGAAANQILPGWTALPINTATGTAFTKQDATTLVMNGNGPTVIQIAIDVTHAIGASVVFGYSIGAGPKIEFARVKLDSNIKVKVVGRYNATLHTNDLVHFWISSDVAYSGFAWSAGELNAFLNQTTGIPEAPIDQNQYTRKGAQWVQVSASGMWRSDVPPVDVERYPQWYNTNTSTLYVWYDDGTSAQWVICVPVPTTDEMSGAIWGSITGTLADQEDLAIALAAKVTQGDVVKAASGATGAAGLTFLAENGTGLYRASAGVVVMTNAGQDVMSWNAIGKKTTAFGPIVLPADPVNPLEAATKQYVDAHSGGGGGGIPDAPSDGTLYGRKDAAWVVVPAGGGGSGLPVDGSGAMTGALKLANGTRAAPALSWASAADTGWYKSTANSMSYAFAGKEIYALSSGGGDYTELALAPEVSGSSQITLYEKNRTDPTGNSLGIAVGQNGVISFNSYSPTFTDYSMSFSAPGFAFNGLLEVYDSAEIYGPLRARRAQINGMNTAEVVLNKGASGASNDVIGQKQNLGRWTMSLGDTIPETGADAGSDFVISRFSDTGAPFGGDSAFRIRRYDGSAFLGGMLGLANQVTVKAAVGGGNWAVATLDTNQGAGTAIEGRKGGLQRWSIILPDGSAETGANAGSDFSITRYDDAGVWAGSSLSINRATGNVTAQGLTTTAELEDLRTTFNSRLTIANQTIDGVHDLLDAALARITALEKKVK